MARVMIRVNMDRLKRYSKENLGVPFIIAFQVMLVMCALLVQGTPRAADELAIYAYYMLVLGVALQLVSYLRRKRE